MALPCDSRRARIAWSIPVIAIVLFWMVGVLGAAVTSFPNPYTFPEVLAAIAYGGWDMFWPGEFGRSHRWVDRVVFWPMQVGPAIAALLWIPCLVPWRTRFRRTASLVIATIIPAWHLPLVLTMGDLSIQNAWSCLFDLGYGEDWQDGLVVLDAQFLWWCLLLPLIVLTARRRVRNPADKSCPACGYSTIGLTGTMCPECGGAVRQFPAPEAQVPG